MRYALNTAKEKIEVSHSGEIGWCPACNSKVRGRKGEINVHHWAHINSKNCDSWYEPITKWHLWWQNHFPRKNREVVVKKSGITHRADILFKKENKNIVIEVQNSSIPLSQVARRESFYQNLIWVLNGETLAKSSRLVRIYVSKVFTWEISFPFVNRFGYEYLTSEMIEKVVNLFKYRFYGNNYFDYRSKGNILEIYFYQDGNIDLQMDIPQLKYYIVGIFQIYNNYDNSDNDEFHQKLQVSYFNTNTNLQKHYLEKSYWRKFIDKMKCHVFIDNLEGLESNELYWYTEDKIVNKSSFISKYQGYSRSDESEVEI